jgi:hypothetical protein
MGTWVNEAELATAHETHGARLRAEEVAQLAPSARAENRSHPGEIKGCDHDAADRPHGGVGPPARWLPRRTQAVTLRESLINGQRRDGTVDRRASVMARSAQRPQRDSRDRRPVNRLSGVMRTVAAVMAQAEMTDEAAVGWQLMLTEIGAGPGA